MVVAVVAALVTSSGDLDEWLERVRREAALSGLAVAIVTLDGKKWKVFQTNYLVRSVFVPEGKHEIKYVFAPVSFKIGLAVSACSLLALLLFAFFPRAISRKK
jgi:hypothetical protein